MLHLESWRNRYRTDDIYPLFGQRIEQAHGVLVADVSPGGPAQKAGIQRGDVILAIDGHDVKSTGELRNVVAAHPSGKSVSVTLEMEARRPLQFRRRKSRSQLPENAIAPLQ